MDKLLKSIILLLLSLSFLYSQECDSLHSAFIKIQNQLRTIEQYTSQINRLGSTNCKENELITKDLLLCYLRLQNLYYYEGNIPAAITQMNIRNRLIPDNPDSSFYTTLSEKYGTLRLSFDHTFTEMGRVKNIENIKLETAQPLSDPQLQKRLNYLNERAELSQKFWLNKFDAKSPEKGFFFEIEYIPYLEYYGGAIETDNFLLLTFDNNVRYHIVFDQFMASDGIIEYKIPWQKNWEYVNEINPDFLAFELPDKYKYKIAPAVPYFIMLGDEGKSTYYVDITNVTDDIKICVEKSTRQRIIEISLKTLSLIIFGFVIVNLF
ncbi:MAG: hypothetical protein JXB49_02305 [Bacteroidales bacterium]|nr:hypothetical protein [Bacteroidales bacterium]